MIKIAFIEDLPEVLSGLVSNFENEPEFEIVGEFMDAESALDMIPKINPNIVISDINLPAKSGVEVVKQISQDFPSIQFMMFTIYEDNDHVFEALKYGAKGYILKNTSPDKIKEAVVELYEGGSPMSPAIARKVLNSFSQQTETYSTLVSNTLSSREFEVLILLSKGFLYKEIADKLSITLSTVKRHLNHIYAKLQVQNKTEAVNKLYGKM